jgi:hypothetical protein
VEPPAQRRRVGRGRKSSVAEAPEPERSVVKVEKMACLLMRESGFFMAALSTGFKEAKDMALDYHADSEQGEEARQLAINELFTTECVESRPDQEPCGVSWQSARTCSCCCG